MLLVIDPVTDLASRLAQAQGDHAVHREPDFTSAETFLDDRAYEIQVIVVGPAIDHDQALDHARKLHEQHPATSLILCAMAAGPTTYREAMRAGVSDVLTWDADADEIREVVSRAAAETVRLRTGAELDEGPELGRTIATFSTKGGCGKSFLATNLAVQLSQTYPGEVVLVDLDLQAGDVAIMLQLAPERGMLEASEMGEGLDEQALAGFLTPHGGGQLKVLAAPSHPVHAESIRAQDLTRVISLLRRMFRHVVIDGPPSFTDHVLATLEQVDTVAVVSSLDVPSIKNLRVSIETLQELGFPRSRMKLVLNRADSKVGLTIREVERSLGTTIDVTIPSSREVPFAVNQGLPIVTARPKAPVSKALIEGLRIITSEGYRAPGLDGGADDTGRRRRRG